MYNRARFIWEMLGTVELEGERRGQRKFQSEMRVLVGNHHDRYYK